jgi:hypothetical protein
LNGTFIEGGAAFEFVIKLLSKYTVIVNTVEQVTVRPLDADSNMTH